MALASVVGQNLVGELSTAEARTRNFSNYSLITASCLLFAPVLTGAFVDLAGGSAACLYVLSLNAIFASDRVLVPVSADSLALKGAAQVERRCARSNRC